MLFLYLYIKNIVTIHVYVIVCMCIHKNYICCMNNLFFWVCMVSVIIPTVQIKKA